MNANGIFAAAVLAAALGTFAADEFDGYAKRDMSEAVDLHAFENGDFELLAFIQ